jgi:hypothetical protein
MALFHFTVTQTKRSKGQSAIASAAYRSGEKLYSEYYGEYSDYTRKGGVICSDILLPPHALKEYADRQTLWNAVEKAERGKNAQLAYSFEISLQNEFSLEENIALAREFLFREFVSRGMTVDVSFHEKECEDGGTPNPHFHFLCPTLRNSGKNMRKKFCSTRLPRMPLMKWESRSCLRSKSCRRSMRNCWKKRKRPMPSTGVLVRKCGSF